MKLLYVILSQTVILQNIDKLVVLPVIGTSCFFEHAHVTTDDGINYCTMNSK